MTISKYTNCERNLSDDARADLAEEIAYLRKCHGLSQTKLGYISDTSLNTVARLEKGKPVNSVSRFKIRTALRLAERMCT